MAEGLRERNKREKLERARKAARELFSRQGFEATTIRQIAERAGIGLGTLYSYVQNKHELLDQLFYEQWTGVEDAAYASLPESASLVDSLLHIFGTMVDSYAKDPELSKTFVKETIFPSSDASPLEVRIERSMRVLIRLGSLVERAQERGEVAEDVEPLIAAANVFALYLLQLSAWFSGLLTREDFLANLRVSLELQLRGLQPAAAGGPRRRSRT